jgi:PAS domain S-box-containing protein
MDAVPGHARLRIRDLPPTKEADIASWNPGARRINGYEADEVIGRHFSVFYTEDDRCNGLPEAALHAAREHGQYETEGWRPGKDGTRFWASVLITALHAADDTWIIRQAAHAEEATPMLAMEKADVLLTDIVLPGQSGIDLARMARERYPDIRIVSVSGAEAPTPEQVGFACASLRKPFGTEQLHALIARMREQTEDEKTEDEKTGET